jgi:hypothetical protein
MIAGRHVARFVLALAGLSLVALGVTTVVSNRLTGHEALGFFAALLTGTAAALWLRRDKRGGAS